MYESFYFIFDLYLIMLLLKVGRNLFEIHVSRLKQSVGAVSAGKAGVNVLPGLLGFLRQDSVWVQPMYPV